MENTTVSFFSNTPPSKKLWTYRETSARIKTLETQLGLAHGSPILNIRRAHDRVTELESALAAKNAAATPAVAAPVAAKTETVTGRARFNASCALDAAAGPKARLHPELHGRDRFSADVRVEARAQVLGTNQSPVPAGLTGRARFAAAVNADFAKKQKTNKAYFFMARIPTESEISTEAGRIGGGNDFFAAKARLEERFAEAERAVANLKPSASEPDVPVWALEPSTASAEISEALAAAESARERAADLLAEQEAVLNSVTNGIHRVGTLRLEISVAKSLLISDDAKKKIAHSAIGYFVALKTGTSSTETTSGFRAMAEDLSWRSALNDHIADFVAPLEKEAISLVASIREQANAAGMDLRKLLAQLGSERGKRAGAELLHNSEFYDGLI